MYICKLNIYYQTHGLKDVTGKMKDGIFDVT